MSTEVRAALENAKLQIGADATASEHFLAETRMRILETLKNVRSKDLAQELLDHSKSYEDMSVDEKVRSYLNTLFAEKITPIVSGNANREEIQEFGTFLLKSVGRIEVPRTTPEN